ncbi:hypothetical protein ACFLTH_10375 [Bacteroidota bacterium]
MKKLFLLPLFFTILFMSCSKEEKKLELFSPDAFAFQLDNGWELNASVQAKGFSIEEVDDVYTARLSYYLNLVLPSGELLEDVMYDIVTEKSEEEIMELSIDAQVELDSSFDEGEYKIIFYVMDDYTEQEVSIEKTFELSQ